MCDESATEQLELDPNDELICVLLSMGWSHKRVASEVGRSTKTIQRRMQDPEFAAEVWARRRASVAATTAQLEQLGFDAVEALRDLLGSANETVVLRAAELTLRMSNRHHRQELSYGEFRDRLTAVEDRVEKSGDQPDDGGSHG
jgi:hypothetical protein